MLNRLCKMNQNSKNKEGENMNKNLVIEAAYETIKESLDWGMDCKDNTYANYVDGIINMTETMLRKFEKENQEVFDQARKYLNNNGTAISYDSADRVY